MANHSVSVKQLVSPHYGGGMYAFLNVIEDEYGCIGVWTNTYLSPTYVFIKEHDVYFMQFTNKDVANEWMLENCLEKDGWKVLAL